MKSSSAHRLGVLLVDDDPDSIDSLAFLVESWGHEARMAYAGSDGIHLTQHWRPDVALLDLQMPGMDGLQLARRLRSQPGMANLTLVALTGLIEDSYRNQALAEGFSFYLLKPVELGTLRRLLEELAVSQRSGARPQTMPEARRFADAARVPYAQAASLEALARQGDFLCRSEYAVRISRQAIQCGRTLVARAREQAARTRLLSARAAAKAIVYSAVPAPITAGENTTSGTCSWSYTAASTSRRRMSGSRVRQRPR